MRVSKEEVRKICEVLGWSSAELAERIGAKRRTVCHWRARDGGGPGFEFSVRLMPYLRRAERVERENKKQNNEVESAKVER